MGFSSAVAHAAATAAATTAGSSAQQQQRRLQRQRRAALGPRECAGRATVGGPRHNSNVGRIRRERAGKRGKGYIKKKKKSHAAGSGGGSRERSQCRSVFGCPQGGSDGQTAMHHARSTRVALRTHRKRRNSTRHTRTHKRHRTRAPSAPKGD